jgi:hypothetical protein
MSMSSTRINDYLLTKLPLLELYSLSNGCVTLDVYESAYLAVASASSHVSIDRSAHLEKFETLCKILLPPFDVISVALLVEHPRPFRPICSFLRELCDVRQFPVRSQQVKSKFIRE